MLPNSTLSLGQSRKNIESLAFGVSVNRKLAKPFRTEIQPPSLSIYPSVTLCPRLPPLNLPAALPAINQLTARSSEVGLHGPASPSTPQSHSMERRVNSTCHKAAPLRVIQTVWRGKGTCVGSSHGSPEKVTMGTSRTLVQGQRQKDNGRESSLKYGKVSSRLPLVITQVPPHLQSAPHLKMNH